MCVTQDIFWTEYTDFNNKIGSFDADEFIQKIKDIKDRSWGDVKSIKSGKIPDIGIDVSEKQSFVYTSDCIESARIKQYDSDKNLMTNFLSHTWNEEDSEFDHQLGGSGELFFRTFRSC